VFRSRGKSFHEGLLGIIVAIVVQESACTTVTYPGPRRPSDAVATIESRDVAIDVIDGVDLRKKGPRFEVLPGDHTLRVRLLAVRRYPLSQTFWLTIVNYSSSMPFCVSAKSKHYYVVEAKFGDGQWAPFISDGASDVQVPPCQTGASIAP
jgi:hypothetical protein